eukprot:c18015_g1_i6.p1 GENE.c18015_g1_i6~~c18015_g1_i6.p1  ORF type:complete len:130 (+),score=13.09 c18015_g1_i6:421-810(+)
MPVWLLNFFVLSDVELLLFWIEPLRAILLKTLTVQKGDSLGGTTQRYLSERFEQIQEHDRWNSAELQFHCTRKTEDKITVELFLHLSRGAHQLLEEFVDCKIKSIFESAMGSGVLLETRTYVAASNEEK